MQSNTGVRMLWGMGMGINEPGDNKITGWKMNDPVALRKTRGLDWSDRKGFNIPTAIDHTTSLLDQFKLPKPQGVHKAPNINYTTNVHRDHPPRATQVLRSHNPGAGV
jgi:hypothetical protein